MAVLDDTGTGNPGAQRRGRIWRKRWTVSPLVIVLGAILLILILPPTLYLIATSVYTTRPDGSFDQLTLRYYQQLFTSPYFASSLWNTAIYAVGSAAVAIVLFVQTWIRAE